jgi:hypothetical protein
VSVPVWHDLAERCALALRQHRGHFPEDMTGACLIASVLLAVVYKHHRIRFKFATTWLKKWHCGHGWVVVDNTSVDLTATQFGAADLVHLRPPESRFMTKTPGIVFRAFRAKSPREVRHISEPRRNYEVLVPALSEVLGISRTEARQRVRDFIGPEVRR